MLALLTVTTRARLDSLASAHLTVLLLVIWGLYAYRDVWPLATFTLAPQDSGEGWILWAKVTLLTLSGVLVPLCAPRAYVPIDPEVRLDLKPLPAVTRRAESITRSYRFRTQSKQRPFCP